jgi:RNA polymerase sigma factor (sigma-70 family)
VDLIGWGIGFAGIAIAVYGLRRGNRQDRQLERIEEFVTSRPSHDPPQEAARRLRRAPPDTSAALFGADVDPELVANALASLPLRERLVFTLRFYDQQTLAAIGSLLGLTRERVRQLESVAIRKMSAQVTTNRDQA